MRRVSVENQQVRHPLTNNCAIPQFMTVTCAILLVAAGLTGPCIAFENATIERIDPQPRQGLSSAVRVTDANLVHTTQLLGSNDSASGADAQARNVLARLETLLDAFHSKRSDVVRLNAYVRNATVRSIFEKHLADWFEASPPAVSYVATPLPDSRALVAVDAVFVSRLADQTKSVTFHRVDALGAPAKLSHVAVLPRGDVIYISGQAEPGELDEATRDTLAGLLKTLAHCGLQQRHVVQIKCFVAPMKDVGVVNEQIAQAFRDAEIPPVVHVEWVAGSRPIEIELIAGAPSHDSSETVTFSTPPWMKSSPVFSRVARIHGNDRIYTSGLYANKAGDGENQVRSVFGLLETILSRSSSDMKHLAKATYYVSDADSSGQLNRFRPSVYDPLRPPAASKAMVRDVARKERSITFDIIATPTRTTGSEDPTP